MPSAIRYVDPNDKSREVLSISNTEMDDRATNYEALRNWYHGNQPRPLVSDEDEPDFNVTLNFVKQATDRTVGFLFPKMPVITTDPDIVEETKVEGYIRKTLEANGGINLLHDMAMIGEWAGDVFVLVDMPNTLNEHDYPGIYVLAPNTVQIFWNMFNLNQVLWYEVRYGDDENGYFVTDYVNNGGMWTIIKYKSNQDANYEEYERVEWKYRVSPLIHIQHLPNPGHVYGLAGFTPSQIDLQAKLNLVASQVNQILYYHASPKTIATGTSAKGIEETGVKTLWAVSSPDAEIYNLEMKSDLTSALEHIKLLRDSFLSESRVVILQGAVKDFQRVTNAGVRTVFLDPLTKNAVLRSSYGTLLSKIARCVARIGMYGEIEPQVAFEDALPTDQTEVVNVQMLQQQMGIVSRETLSTLAGYRWTVELDKMRAEAEIEMFMKPETSTSRPNMAVEPGSLNNR